jgi:hypothetical protein
MYLYFAYGKTRSNSKETRALRNVAIYARSVVTEDVSTHPENPNQVQKCKKNRNIGRTIHVVPQKSGIGFCIQPIIKKLQNMLLIVTYKGSNSIK